MVTPYPHLYSWLMHSMGFIWKRARSLFSGGSLPGLDSDQKNSISIASVRGLAHFV